MGCDSSHLGQSHHSTMRWSRRPLPEKTPGLQFVAQNVPHESARPEGQFFLLSTSGMKTALAVVFMAAPHCHSPLAPNEAVEWSLFLTWRADQPGPNFSWPVRTSTCIRMLDSDPFWRPLPVLKDVVMGTPGAQSRR